MACFFNHRRKVEAIISANVNTNVVINISHVSYFVVLLWSGFCPDNVALNNIRARCAAAQVANRA